MAGITINVDIDDKELRKGLRDRLAAMGNLSPFHKSVGEHLLNSTDDRFQTETAPDGSVWKALAPSTLDQRAARGLGVSILRARGRLAGSFNYRADADQVQIGTPMVYAAIHHHGGEAGRNKAVTIPARPILGISGTNWDAIEGIAEDFLTM